MSTPLMAHDNFWLVALAVVICAAGAFASFTVFAHSLARRHAKAWLLLTGFCAGSSTWATHFVATLAHDIGAPTSYDPILTFISSAVAVAVMTAGFAMSLSARRTRIAAGGAIIGAGVAAMHFIGMQAVQIQGIFRWNIDLALLSILFGACFSAAGLVVFREWKGLRGHLSAALLLTLGIYSLHFTAMEGLTIEFRPEVTQSGSAIDATILAIAIAGVTGLILSAGYIVALIDGRAAQDIFTRAKELVDAAIEGLIIANDGVIVNVNGRVSELCGRKNEDLCGKNVFGDVLSGKPPSSAKNQHVFTTSLLKTDGTAIPVEVVRRSLRSLNHGNEAYAIRDLREREAAARQVAEANQELTRREEELRTRNGLLNDALGAMSQGLCMYDTNQTVVICNQRFSTLYGLPKNAIQTGMHLKEVVQKRIDNGVYAGPSPAAYMEDRLAPVYKAERNIHELNDGRLIAVARRPMAGGGWLTTHDDVTEQKRMEAQLKQLSHHDRLTGLLRRDSFCDVLSDALKTANKRNRRVAVFIIGIDRFDEINDSLGHSAGDSMLKTISERLQESTRRATTIGRTGDHTFGIIEFVEHPEKDAAGFANRTLAEIRKPLIVGETSFMVTATIGIATSPTAGKDAGTLLKNAALAQNRGKVEARGSYHFFDPAMDKELKARRMLEKELGEALEKRQFEVRYQPQVNLAHNEVTGFEALLHWQHPAQGRLEPDAFLPVAETLGLLGAISEWLIKRACSEASGWPQQYNLAMNLSGAQLRTPNFVGSLVNILASTGLAANRLQFEVSEKVLSSYKEEAISVLRGLSDLGVHVTMADFGSGLSSLAYLRQFPVQKVKVDRSFVDGLKNQSEAQAIIRTLARLGSALGMNTMVAGIETKEQLDLVRTEGYTEMQGQYFSPPKAGEEISRVFLARVNNGRKRAARS